MTTTATATPTEWQMYPTRDDRGNRIATPGDDFLTVEMGALAREMRSGLVKPTDLYDLIRVVQERCVEAGFGEVHDTEPEWAIADFVNAVCDELGWAHVDRWEF